MTITNEYRSVGISEILNFVENPRHDVGINEIDTIKKLINKVGSQYMYNLAKDIYENGLMRSNLPILVFDSKKNKYVVYEGNRRIACLKFLNAPTILSSIDKALMKRIENLISNNQGVIETSVHCYITTEEQAFLMMKRIHSGEDKGRGLKAWSAKEKEIFQERINKKKSTALIIVELSEKLLKKDITKVIDFSTIQRFFNTRKMKKTLGLDKGESSNITKEKIELINYLIEQSVKESKQRGVALTRLFNKTADIESFFIPLIEEYNKKDQNFLDQPSDESVNDDVTPIGKYMSEEAGNQGSSNGEAKESSFEESGVSTSTPLKIGINKDDNSVYFTNQTVDLGEKLLVENSKSFNLELLSIECQQLTIFNGIVQPNNLPGDYIVTYKYYKDSSRSLIYWQDTIKITLKIPKSNSVVMLQQAVLSRVFMDKYIDQLIFDHSEKIKALMFFLATENKNGKYSFFINIVSRMFLEFVFRMYASKVLKYDNQTIEEKCNSLPGFIDHCCSKIENSNPQMFVKHIKKGRTDATKKIDLLQKSVHYYDVTISNDDIQAMFTNLSLYLEYVFNELIKEQFQEVAK